MSEYPPGTRVAIRNAGSKLSGKTGVVVHVARGLRFDYEVLVLLDDIHGQPDIQLGFYEHELRVTK